jgi:hypothetical protein
VDWDCEVVKSYSDVNLGCGRRPATGLSWIFDQVEEAIILEDDCLPHPTFFRFCEELLEKYRDDERVMHISGDNYFFRETRIPFSYSFSCYCLSWGWATWRRAFQHYDPEIKQWPALRNTSWLADIVGNPRAIQHWAKIFDTAYAAAGSADYWDFQWLFATWAHRGLSILPNTNLVSNVGFREDGTHTRGARNTLANLPRSEMSFPLKHPLCMVRNKRTDEMIFEQTIMPRQRSLYEKLCGKFAAAMPDALRRSLASLRSRVSNSLDL